ncbi:carbohydrate kinase family protein [Acidobacterium sp. S8]|uniref:carbohydrate kinase family protein n=1 Tax=Acidobacterium sp. S8 TaxID=1641854 RepID=UPI00131B7744|nr:carbohydrate kinase family protein [Acidobacterium sp. S8]
MKKLWDVAVAGEIFADHVFAGFERWPQPGEELFTDCYVREVGGGAAITACALARLGRQVALFAVGGRGDTWIEDRLRSFGVIVEDLRLVEEGTAVTVSLSTREDRSFFTWPGANRQLAEHLRNPETQARMAQSRHVHFAVALERELAQELFPPLKQAGCTISIDPGHHPNWLKNPENWRTCGEVDFFLPNEKEGQIMTGQESPESILRELASADIRGVVLKLGSDGAAALVNDRTFQARPFAIEVVDTTGAGDAFDAGLIDAFLDSRPLPSAIEQGCLCGSLSTRQAGAISALPRREELELYHDKLKQS